MRKTTIFILLLGASLTAVSQTADYLSNARSYYENEQYNEALDALSTLNQRGEKNFDMLLLQGNCYQKTDDFKAASQAYASAEKLDDKSAILYANWSAALYNMSDINAGEEKAKTALKLDKHLPEANYFMGNLKHHEYSLLAALKYYNTAIKLKPDYRDALYMRAATHAELKNYRAALRDYEAVLELDPNLAVAKYNIGVIQLVNEMYDAAAKTFAELNPEKLDKPTDYYFYQAEALYFDGKKEDACELYEKAKNLGDSESTEIYQKYCVNKQVRDPAPGKKRTIRATF